MHYSNKNSIHFPNLELWAVVIAVHKVGDAEPIISHISTSRQSVVLKNRNN